MSKVKDRKMSSALRALGHPARVQIVRQLQDKGACYAGEISRKLPVAASTVSQHLKILREAGLIDSLADGPHRCYSINSATLAELKDWFKSL